VLQGGQPPFFLKRQSPLRCSALSRHGKYERGRWCRWAHTKF